MPMSSWIQFDTPFQVAANTIAIALWIVALAMLVRRLFSRRGLRWRDLLLLGGLTFNGVAIPLFTIVWLIAEWVSTAPAEPLAVEGSLWPAVEQKT